MTYNRQWSSNQPGCLIILLDQSGSMSGKFGGQQAGAGKKKCDMVALVVNNLLHEFARTNTVGEIIKPRADIAVIGYGGSVCSALAKPLSARDFVTLPELMDHPLRVETRVHQDVTEDGQITEVPMQIPIWVEPKSSGGTPMREAFGLAHQLCERWTQAHPASYPPVVVNVSDGAPNCDPKQAAELLCTTGTADGNTLLFNCHITSTSATPITYPCSEASVPKDKHAILMYSMSSIVPESARTRVVDFAGEPLAPGARGFIFNGDAASVRSMFLFATLIASPDPNR